MIKYLQNGEINRNKWDHCVNTSRQNLIYGFSWYLDLVAPGWSGIVLDDYKAVMPLPVRSKLGISYIYQPVYAQQLGIYSRLLPDKDLTEKFLDTIPLSFRYIDYNLNQYHRDRISRFRYTGRTNYELKLNTAYEDIESRFSENTKRNIQKSILHIELAKDVSVPEMVKLKRSIQTKKRDARFYEWLNTYMHKLIQTGRGHLIGIRHEGKLVAGVFFVVCMNRIYYLVSASNEKGKEIRAMFAIVDHLIGKYADTGLILDFEGSSIKGIARFFAGFGAEKTNYFNISANSLPFPLNLLKK